MPSEVNAGFDPKVDIRILKPHPKNANQGDFGAIEQSMKVNGFYGALIVNKRTNHILAGNHRYKVAGQLGFQTLPVHWVDVDEREEVRIMLADNRTTRLGQDDENVLADLLADLLQNSDNKLDGTGYDGDDLDDIIARISNSEFTDEDFKEVGSDIDTNRQCPQCGFKWSQGT